LNEKEYKSDFGIDPKDKTKLDAALDRAHDIRKFEIELYWKRATYFWTLIAATFAGYFVVLSADKSFGHGQKLFDKEFLSFILACMGFLFTFAWFQVSRGSKKWQENWENHVDMLEDTVTGPLHKTILVRNQKKDTGFYEKFMTGPGHISVSKTNQIVNLYVLCVWVALAYGTLSEMGCNYPLSIKHLIIGIPTLLFCWLIRTEGKTYPGNHNLLCSARSTKISES
jgi:hypothetical protein